MLYLGLTDQNKLDKNKDVPILRDESDDDDEDDEKQDDKGLLSGEEGDGFAGALYSGSRFRGASLAPSEEPHIPRMSQKGVIVHEYDDLKSMEKPPPPAYSDYGDDNMNDIAPEELEEEHFGDILPSNHSKNMSVAIEAGKVKNVAAKLAIDPTAMLPGAKIPKPVRNEEVKPIENNASLAKPAAPAKRKKSGDGSFVDISRNFWSITSEW